MTFMQPKVRNRFRVRFDNFGKGDDDYLTNHVIRVTRPGMVVRDEFQNFGLTETFAKPIELTLRDDVADVTRTEVITQIIRQTTDDATFTMIIETISLSGENILEQWYLSGCRIVDCNLDELNYADSAGLTINLIVDPKRVDVSLNGTMVTMLS